MVNPKVCQQVKASKHACACCLTLYDFKVSISPYILADHGPGDLLCLSEHNILR